MKKVNSDFSQRYILYTLFFVAILVSLQHAWVPGFFSDGYLYAAFGKNAASNGSWLVPSLTRESYNEFFHHTPFVFILEGLLFKAFGASYLTARLFSSIFFLLTFVVLYKCKEQMKGSLPFVVLFFFITIPPLMKKVRFPNIDLPLMFFFVACFYFFFQAITKDKKNWYLCGLFFGLSLLTKGPVAFLLPICMFLSLIFSKSLKQLKLITPWLGLLLGLVVFSVWPITLYINDKFYIYEQWFDFTFIHTIKDSRGDASPFYTYIVFLFKNAPLWFICSLVGSFYTLRTKNIFEICVLSFFWGIVVLLSLASFKYSNYLIPAYPFMAILAGIGVVNLIPKLYIDKFLNAIPYLFAVASLSLLIFPLTNKIRREKGVFKVKEVFKSVNFFPEDYYIVGGVYPYWNLNSLNAWENRNVITKSISAPDILRKSEDFCLSCSIFASQEVAEALVQKFETLGIVARLSRDNIFVIAPKKKISSNPIMVFKR